MSDILADYEKDLIDRAELTLDDVMFLEPEELAGEVRHRIPLERCEEIRGLLQLTSLKGLTLPTAKVLYQAGIRTRWEFLNLDAGGVLEKVASTGAGWGEKERKKVQRILEQNAGLLDDI